MPLTHAHTVWTAAGRTVTLDGAAYKVISVRGNYGTSLEVTLDRNPPTQSHPLITLTDAWSLKRFAACLGREDEGCEVGTRFADQHGIWVVDSPPRDGCVTAYRQDRGKGHAKIWATQQVRSLAID